MDSIERLDAITNLGYEWIQPYRHILIRLLNEDEMNLVALYIGYSSNYQYTDNIDEFDSTMEEVIATGDYTLLDPIIKGGQRYSEVISMFDEFSTRFPSNNQRQEYDLIVLDGELFKRLIFEELDGLDNRLINYAGIGYDSVKEDDLRSIPDTISLRSIAAILVYIGFLKDRNSETCIELLDILSDNINNPTGKNIIGINRIVQLGEEVIILDDLDGWSATLLSNPNIEPLKRDYHTELQDRSEMSANIPYYIYSEVEDGDIVDLIRTGVRLLTYEWIRVLFMETDISITTRILAYIGFIERRQRTPPLIAVIRDAVSQSTGVNIDIINQINDEGDLIMSPYISDDRVELLDVRQLSLLLNTELPESNILTDVESMLNDDRLREYAAKGYRILIPEVVEILLNRIGLYDLTDILIYVGFLIKNNLGVVNKIIGVINDVVPVVNDANSLMIESLVCQGISVATMTILGSNVKKTAFKKLINPDINQLANESPELLNKKLISITAKAYRDKLSLSNYILNSYDISVIRAILSVTVHNSDLRSVRDLILYVEYLSEEDSRCVRNRAAHRLIEIIRESIVIPGDVNAPNILQHLADYGKLLYNSRSNLDDKHDILANTNFQALNHPYEPGYIISIENKIDRWIIPRYSHSTNMYIKNGYRLLGIRTDDIERLVPAESMTAFLLYIGFIIDHRMDYRELLSIIEDAINTNDQSMIDIIIHRGTQLLEAIDAGDDARIKRFATTSDIFYNIPR